MLVLVAMSGGVDSSVAAARLIDDGHDVVGVTLRLWGGTSDAGCCSVADTDDARRVADHLGIDHYTFAMSDRFDRHVVDPYVADHAAGRTPNPCIECNRHLKFGTLLDEARRLGADAVATGHHARITAPGDGRSGAGSWSLWRGADAAKDQSYVVSMLDQATMPMVLFPVGDGPKEQLRREAAARGLRTAAKPDSQDVCFIGRSSGRRRFLADRMDLHPADIVDGDGATVGRTDAVELVTIGQRKGLDVAGSAGRRYVTHVDVAARRVTVGARSDLLCDTTPIRSLTWTEGPWPAASSLSVQVSAHGAAVSGRVHADDAVVEWTEPHERVAPGQSVVLYDGDRVVGAAVAG